MDVFTNIMSSPTRPSPAPNNENLRPPRQRIPQPTSRIPTTPGRNLHIFSESETNARSMIRPPSAVGSLSLKHKPSALPEPAPKRKTLAERAGETVRHNAPAPPSSRPVAAGVRATAISGFRNASFASSVSSRPASAASRNVSGSSLASSVGSGTRSTSIGSNRSQSALSYNKRVGPNIPAGIRPGTALDLASIDEGASPDGATWNGRADTDEHFEKFLSEVSQMKDEMKEREAEYKSSLLEQVELYKQKVTELEGIRSNLAATNAEFTTTNHALQGELEEMKSKLAEITLELTNLQRANTINIDDLDRRYRNEIEDLKEKHKREYETVRRQGQEEAKELSRAHRDELRELEHRLKAELDEEKTRRLRELQEQSTQFMLQRQKDELETSNKDREAHSHKTKLAQVEADLEQERALIAALKIQVAERSTTIASLEASKQDMTAKIKFLESNNENQSLAFVEMNQRMQDAINSATEANTKLRAEETLRRKLHNQVQELKGNIRVFCRVRPAMGSEVDDSAKISIPDEDQESKELLVMGPEQKSSLGNITTSKQGFSFDRVFGPSSNNLEVFDEISQLIQSALDGYNVCIFCYGQTGSGKTHTMSSQDGMIPLAVHQIYSTATSLAEKGWTYTMEGSFVEVYLEHLNDLLGNASDFDKPKLEIRHDKGKTTVKDLTSMNLDDPEKVTTLLSRAAANRSVAATKANERSSRGHSVFMLKLTGQNSITGESSEGTLNLVDLAGSERLGHSQATGQRLKETQSINTSLSCLGDVISALGQGKEGGHVPYRNSKLTYLLQNSLGGNSKTLMFVMISPLQAHLNETITSLKFATKVHNTHIGTAKRQSKVV